MELVNENNKAVNRTEEIFNKISNTLVGLKNKIDKISIYSENMKDNKDTILDVIQNISAV